MPPKIKDYNKSYPRVKFGNLKIGDYFYGMTSNELYIKMTHNTAINLYTNCENYFKDWSLFYNCGINKQDTENFNVLDYI